jgi:HK97 family phage prohead protease
MGVVVKFKSCAGFKAAPDTAESGVFEAIVSVFGNVDSMGDVVMPGAFTESLAAWEKSGDPIPVLWSHRMDDPRFSIGHVLEAAELEPGDPRIPEWADDHVKAHGGLWVRAQLDTGADAGDVAVAARKLLRNRLVKQFSYAYEIQDADWGTVGGQDAYQLRKLSLYEVSPTQIGANNLTELVGAKASKLVAHASDANAEPMRRLVADMDIAELCKAHAVLGGAIAGRTTEDASDTSDSGTVKDEEPVTVKSEEPARRDVESIRLQSAITTMELEYAS